MTGARILAAGGTTASLMVMLGSFLHSPVTVGAAGAVMLAANLAVLFGVGKERSK